MPSSRASRRAGRIASDNTSRGYRVAGEAESAARAKAKEKPSSATNKLSKAAAAKSKAKPQLAARPSTTATASDWRAGFGLLMHNLAPEAREAVEKAASELEEKAVSASRKNALTSMADIAAKLNDQHNY